MPWARVPIIYDPADPYDARIDSFFGRWLVPMLLGAIGSVFLCTGGGMLLFPYLSRRRTEWFKTNGMRICADVVSVEVNLRVTVNGTHPHKILCRGSDPFSGQVRGFRSRNLYYDPEPLLKGRKQLDVWLDPKDRDRYLVDTDCLEATNEPELVTVRTER